MTRNRKLIATRLRHSFGMSLIELLSAILIMSFVGVAITELCAAHNIVAFRTVGKMDGIVNARRAIALFDYDVRLAKAVPSSYTPAANIPGDNSVATWNAPAPNYVADYQTLILTQPIFDQNGYVSTETKTVIYKILPDKRDPGKGLFVLQKKDFSVGGDPQTILTGIVGPINPSDVPDSIANTPPPKVFKPLIKLAEFYRSAGIPSNYYPPTSVPSALTKGAQVTLEIFDTASQSQSATPKSIAFSREVYTRGNYAAIP